MASPSQYAFGHYQKQEVSQNSWAACICKYWQLIAIHSPKLAASQIIKDIMDLIPRGGLVLALSVANNAAKI